MKKRIVLCCATWFLLASLGACSSTADSDMGNASSNSSSNDTSSSDSSNDTSGSDSSNDSAVEETVEERETIYVVQDGYTIEMPVDLTHVGLREYARTTDWGYDPLINLVTVAYDKDSILELLLQLEADVEAYAQQNGFDKEELLHEELSQEYTDWTTATGVEFSYISVCYTKMIPDIPNPWDYLLFLVQDDLCFWIDTTVPNEEAIPEMENYILSMFDTMVVGPEGIALYETSDPQFFYHDENDEAVFITQAQANGTEEIE